MNILLPIKTVEKLIEDNAPTILAGVAIVGTCATGYLAARGALKAQAAADKLDRDEEPTAMRDILRTAPYYLPALGTAGVTIACIVCANRISASRVAAVAAAYSLSEKKLGDYKQKIEEKFGIEKSKEVDEDIARDAIKKMPRGEIIILGKEESLCFDAHSGRYFKSTMEEIKRAQNDTNLHVINNRYASLNVFWDEIGLEPTAYSDDYGWGIDCPLEVRFSTTMSSDDKPCLLVDYDVEPLRRWNHRD